MAALQQHGIIPGRAVFDAAHFFEKSGVSRETMEKIHIYEALLCKWQKKINLISEASLPDRWRRHFYDSFQLKDHIQPRNSTTKTAGAGNNTIQILDIGSGAGFPGLVLSLLAVGECHLVESNGKKAAFMNQVIRETGCRAVVHNQRIEELPPFAVDYITSRACAGVDKLLHLSHHFIRADTVCLFLKGQSAVQEITAARQNWRFDVKKFTSVTEESGAILKVSHIKALRPKSEGK